MLAAFASQGLQVLQPAQQTCKEPQLNVLLSPIAPGASFMCKQYCCMLLMSSRSCLDRSSELIANGTTDLNGVKLLHFSPDPVLGAVDPTYFQYYEGLLNITSPTAAGNLTLPSLTPTF